jgi:glycosyltransferase involved in cell wall biosynthesis
MGKALVMTRTQGQADLVSEGETGLRVPPGDSVALRSAIERLLADPGETARMGQAGRARIEERNAMDPFVARIAAFARRNRAEVP